MKTLLVPTDFSTYAAQATNMAAKIATITGAQIAFLTNVATDLNWKKIRPVEQHNHPETLAKTVEAGIKLDRLLQSSQFKNITVSKIVTHGVTYENVVAQARHLKADLIILGSHGNEASDRFFIGSNIQKIMREADCPVLAVKKETANVPWKKILFAGEFDGGDGKYFEAIKKIALEFKSRIHLLYVNMPAKFKDTATVQNQMDDFAKKYPNLKFEKAIYNQYELEDGILEYARARKIDLIAMITHNRRHSPAYRIGTTESIVFRSMIPVLSISPSPAPIR